jgi:hypothetical protein
MNAFRTLLGTVRSRLSRLSRVQLLVLWATMSLMFTALLYPPTVVRRDDQGVWREVAVQRRFVADASDAWVESTRERKTRYYYSYRRGSQPESRWVTRSISYEREPHVIRMIAETAFVLLIGSGLVYALGRRPQAIGG